MTAIGARFAALASLTLLGGCDDVYGPTLQNAFGHSVELAVTYSDGSVQVAPWPACRVIHVGRANMEVVELSISDGDRGIELSATRIHDLLQGEVATETQIIWRVSGSDIVRVDTPRSPPCESTDHD